MPTAGRYKILVKSLPPALVPLSLAPPRGHSIDPRYAHAEEEALTECLKLMRNGYSVELIAPSVCVDDVEFT